MRFFRKRGYFWLVLTILLGSYFFLNKPFRNIKVFASYNYLDEKELEKIVKSGLRGGFFGVNNLYYLRDQILQNGWVESVSIKRQWPGGLVINVVEQKPILWWNEQLVNDKGELFFPGKEFVLDLPRIESINFEIGDILEIYKVTSDLVWPFKLVKIKKVIDHYWQLEFEPCCIFILGVNQPAQSLMRIYPVLKKITNNFNKIPKKVDARYSGDLAVKW